MIRKARGFNGGGGGKQLTNEQAAQMKDLADVKAVGFSLGAQAGISYGSATENTSVLGVSESYQRMINLELAGGNYLTDKDGEKRNKVALLGDNIARLLFGEDLSGVVGKTVTIKGRKYEVKGVSKSIGAKRSDILMEFLFESVLISVAGGITGSGLSLFTLPLLKYLDLQAIPSTEGILLGLVFSVITGAFFGYYPALKASRLKPIQALNYE